MPKPIITKTTKQILMEARESASMNGMNKLTTGQLVRQRGDGAFCYCALGHIALAAGYNVVKNRKTGHHGFAYVDDNYRQLNRLEAVKMLARAIDPDHGAQAPISVVLNYNDSNVGNGRGELVIQAFDKAIASCTA